MTVFKYWTYIHRRRHHHHRRCRHHHHRIHHSHDERNIINLTNGTPS